MEKMKNQMVSGHPLFFDPLNKKAVFPDSGVGGIYYEAERPAVVVFENGDVEFTYYAPNARTVEVAGISGSFPREKISLEKQACGCFSTRVSGLKKGFHYTEWFVDGEKAVNPSGMFCYGCFQSMNFFEIPQDDEDFYLLKDVPHGTVRLEQYRSGVNGRMKTAYIYTPPGYEADTEKKYPVLYLQHGVGENEIGWIWSGKANFIMDNLIAAGKCEDIILVMNSGYAFVPGEDPVFYPGDFDSELVYDCIPFIEAHFRVESDRSRRAIAGLSLGSAQAALTAVRHPDLFCAFGVFSGVSTNELDTVIENKIPYEKIFLSCGKGESGLAERLAAYGEKLNAAGVPTDVRSYEGYHEWSPWRNSLRDFVQGIFKKEIGSLPACGGTLLSDRVKAPPAQGQNQAYFSFPLFQDPLHKQVIYAVDKDGNPAGRYGEVPPGIEVLEQGKVQFTFFAPGAEKVEAQFLGGERFSLEKEEDGGWRTVRENVVPGFHYIDFYINGTLSVNPQAAVGYGAFRAINFFEMPDPAFDAYLLRDVPHGSVRLHYYRSSQTGRVKIAYVYAPPGYDKTEKKYPVLYLQHGGGENEVGWLWQGKIGNIADNLLAQGEMQEMLIVMTTGYCFREDGTSHPALGSFADELPADLVPFIDRQYRTIADKHSRAIAGLSMGAMQAQRILLNHLDIFANGGIFSGGLTIKDKEVDFTRVLCDKEVFEKEIDYLFVACGEQEGFYDVTTAAVQNLRDEYGIPLTYYHVPGVHDWTFWRHCAAEFLPELFKK